ncbi:MAG: M23 family metallopeptidase, partial [Acidobacteriota bacterium]
PIASPAIDESTPQPLPFPLYSQTPALSERNGSTSLMIPVSGVTADQLTDTFEDARSEGRTHEAIDIPAAAGTPVIAAADGRIVKFWDSRLGGITIYQSSADEKFFYYYAHLQKRADGLREGEIVRRGTTIGFVGDTGNAGAGNYHLHFAVSEVVDSKRYWDGRAIDPYPLLKSGASAR